MKSNSYLVPSKLKLYNQEPVFHHKLHQNYVLQKFLNMLRLTFVLIIRNENMSRCYVILLSISSLLYNPQKVELQDSSLMTKELA